jgi:hypothetical protein
MTRARSLLRTAAIVIVVPATLAGSGAALEVAAQGRSAGGPPLDVAGLDVAGFEDYRMAVRTPFARGAGKASGCRDTDAIAVEHRVD